MQISLHPLTIFPRISQLEALNWMVPWSQPWSRPSFFLKCQVPEASHNGFCMGVGFFGLSNVASVARVFSQELCWGHQGFAPPFMCRRNVL